MACNNSEGKIEVKEVTLYEVEEEVSPPHPDVHSNFKNIEEWLVSICDGEKPDKPISLFKIGLFESSEVNTIYLVGVNKYEKGNSSHTSLEFEPSKMYCNLQEDAYKGLSRENLLTRLTDELKGFTQTEKFRNSFLAAADAIVFESNGRVIWKS